MATNFVQPGDTLTIPAPADVLSGGVVIAGTIVGIAAGDADSGDTVDVHVTGVFTLPKVGADAFTLGEPSIGTRPPASRPPPARATPRSAWPWRRLRWTPRP